MLQIGHKLEIMAQKRRKTDFYALFVTLLTKMRDFNRCGTDDRLIVCERLIYYRRKVGIKSAKGIGQNTRRRSFAVQKTASGIILKNLIDYLKPKNDEVVYYFL